MAISRFCKYLLVFIIISFTLLFFPILSFSSEEKEKIDVKRDKEKTVYTIDGGDDKKKEQKDDRENSWEMLKNMKLWIEKK
ncbi:MAG: hypothetical protein N2745_01020 [Syntrophorhabdaceae bacterium]|nr:hypothetical protein [Syntrophorhabdaceae bacterium]